MCDFFQLEGAFRFGRDGEALVEIGKLIFTGFEYELEFAAFEDGAVVIAEDREEDFVLEEWVGWVPVDVEVRGEF